MGKEKWVAINGTINLIGEHIEIRNCCAEYICKKLNKQAERIAELEEQMKNAIVPKFNKGQEVFYINSRNKISSGIIYNIRYDSMKGFDYYIPMLQIEDFRIKEECLFATKEEAQTKLEELGERK